MKIKVLFIGGTQRGFEILQLLIRLGKDVVFAYILKEDDHETVQMSGQIEEYCQLNNIPSSVSRRITKDHAGEIAELNADVAVVCGWRTLIPKEIYGLIPYFTAAHDSLLPKYRGFAPLNWAIINGEKETGVTLFKIVDGPADSGPIFGQKRVVIEPEETAIEVYKKNTEATISLYRDFFEKLDSNSLEAYEQVEAEATVMPKRKPEDGEVDWMKSSEEIFNLIRALAPPYPCARTKINGKNLLITEATLKQTTCSDVQPGNVVEVSDKGVTVACGEGEIIINNVLNENGEEIPASAMIASPVKLGD